MALSQECRDGRRELVRIVEPREVPGCGLDDQPGLVLLPSVFNWPNVGVDKSPVTTASIRYPAVGVGLLWEPPPALAGLAPVLGHTRTSLLGALAEPLTTAALASRLGISPSAVSQHLGALRGAGLVSTQRNGRTALHLRTERANQLLK